MHGVLELVDVEYLQPVPLFLAEMPAGLQHLTAGVRQHMGGIAVVHIGPGAVPGFSGFASSYDQGVQIPLVGVGVIAYGHVLRKKPVLERMPAVRIERSFTVLLSAHRADPYSSPLLRFLAPVMTKKTAPVQNIRHRTAAFRCGTVLLPRMRERSGSP